MTATYRVVVRRIDGTEEQVIGTGLDERAAEKVERGLLRNMDTDRWFVAMEPEAAPSPQGGTP